MERYTFDQKVAEGAYGAVWRCTDTVTGEHVAVKKLKDPPQTKQDADFAMREVKLLQQINHINVVKLIEAYQSASGRLYLVFEYIDNTVLQLLKSTHSSQHPGLPLRQVLSITYQLATALAHLHTNKIIHRDIKPSNILISNQGAVKLCDFGFARPFAMGSETAAQYTTYVVTRWYRPPEVLVGDTYGPAVDIWALGCIFVELVTGKPLFPGKTQHDQLWLVLKAVGKLTDRQMKVMRLDRTFECFKMPAKHEHTPLEALLHGFPQHFMELVYACLQPDASKRATAEQLLSLPIFDGIEELLPLECRHIAQECRSLPQDIEETLDRIRAQHQPHKHHTPAIPPPHPPHAKPPHSDPHTGSQSRNPNQTPAVTSGRVSLDVETKAPEHTGNMSEHGGKALPPSKVGGVETHAVPCANRTLSDAMPPPRGMCIPSSNSGPMRAPHRRQSSGDVSQPPLSANHSAATHDTHAPVGTGTPSASAAPHVCGSSHTSPSPASLSNAASGSHAVASGKRRTWHGDPALPPSCNLTPARTIEDSAVEVCAGDTRDSKQRARRSVTISSDVEVASQTEYDAGQSSSSSGRSTRTDGHKSRSAGGHLSSATGSACSPTHLSNQASRSNTLTSADGQIDPSTIDGPQSHTRVSGMVPGARLMRGRRTSYGSSSHSPSRAPSHPGTVDEDSEVHWPVEGAFAAHLRDQSLSGRISSRPQNFEPTSSRFSEGGGHLSPTRVGDSDTHAPSVASQALDQATRRLNKAASMIGRLVAPAASMIIPSASKQRPFQGPVTLPSSASVPAGSLQAHPSAGSPAVNPGGKISTRLTYTGGSNNTEQAAAVPLRSTVSGVPVSTLGLTQPAVSLPALASARGERPGRTDHHRAAGSHDGGASLLPSIGSRLSGYSKSGRIDTNQRG